MKHAFYILAALLVSCTALQAQTAGDFQSHQTGNWSDVNSWERFDGSLWITPAPAAPASTDGVITLLDGHTISVDAATTVDQVIVNAGGTVKVVAGQTLTVADGADSIDLVVSGTLNMFGTVTATGRISFENGGLYIHSVLASLPSSTWRTGSTCKIDSSSGSSPTNLNTQSLYNLTWNATNQGANGGPNFGDGAVIAGDLTVSSSKSLQWRVTNLSSGQTKNIYIRGNVFVNGATALLTSTGSGADTAAKAIVNVDGNISVTAGTWSMLNSSNAYAEWKVKGNVSITGGGLTNGGGTYFKRRTLNFCGGATQTFTLSAPGTINTSATVYKVSNGSTVQVNFPWTLMASGALSLEKGKFVSTSTNFISLPATGTILGGSDTAYVDGPLTLAVASTSPTMRTFPIGKGPAYRPVAITVNQDAATSTQYTAEIFNSAPPSRTLPGTLGSVSSVRFCTVTKGSGANISPTLGATMQMSYNSDDGVTDASILRIAKDDGAGNWVNLGGSGTANTSGTITSNAFFSFSDFVLATEDQTPVPASVIWTEATNGSPTISGLLNAANHAPSDSLEVYGYTNVGGTPCAWMVTKSHIWNAETAPNLTRYIQYAVGPQAGGTLHIDSIAFKLGAAFTNNLQAGVYYSKDSTFTTYTVLIADTPLVASTLVQYSFNGIADTIETGETFYLRIYPFNTANEGWAKLMYVAQIGLFGNTVGLAVLPPTVSTTDATNISATFATSGGNVSADGGGAVTARGVCWNTTGDPTISDSYTSDGTGNGVFTSSVTGLTAGATYYLRAYATNAGGTAYGIPDTFATLAAIVAPTVTTNAASSVLVTTAISGGNVTAWGGATVTGRGVCWNLIGSPTLADNFSEDGSGLGSFVSGLAPLVGNTPYYVRAYATNSAGTGYGNEITFTTQTPSPDTTVTVAWDGTGDYLTVQAAFNAVPVGYTGKWTIFVKDGVYYEKMILASGKINVTLIGQSRDNTILTYDDYADRYGSGNPGTSGSYSIAIDANDFTAKDITFRNTYSPQPGVSGTQAVALRTQGDRHEYVNCKILGYQDTYYTWGGSGTGRMYHKNCYIEGTVDFIFGRNIVVFDSCTIHIIRNGGTITAASTDGSSKYGYVFRNSSIVADTLGYDGNAITAFYLGRPWQASPRTVLIHTEEPWNLSPAGWQSWNATPAIYGEYYCYGFGSGTASRVAWSTQLSDSLAATYTLSNIFARSSANSSLILYNWMPANAAGNFLPLPVQLASFTGSATNNAVHLNWRTISEVNNYGFYVERKRSSETTWTLVPNSFVAGNGTTNIPHDYAFTDQNVSSGAWQYRLKQVDLDNSVHFSDPILVDVLTGVDEQQAPREFALRQNYPNPFNPQTTIRFSVEKTDRAVLEVFNIIGQRVATLFNGVAEPGKYYDVKFSGTELPSGVYIYRLQSGTRVDLKKLIILK
ncbi:MAG: T9SS type A sorting domain-containing protein [Ignavibacteriae bacterium]|nr:T9SS type A sorting domain-containing protein [Ignavibacteriota bacterium]